MIGVALQIVNLDELKRAHDRVLAQTTTALAQASIDAGEAAVDHVKRHPTFKPRTGKLQDSTEYRTVKLSSGRIVRISNRAKYATAIDQGSPPHMIAARRGKALFFRWKGVPVFRRYVMHPGNKPYRFLFRATSAAGRVLERSMFEKMTAIAKRF